MYCITNQNYIKVHLSKIGHIKKNCGANKKNTVFAALRKTIIAIKNLKEKKE